MLGPDAVASHRHACSPSELGPLPAADDNQADWLQTGMHDALVGPGGALDVAAACGKLARDPEEAVRRGAADISAWADDTRCWSASVCLRAGSCSRPLGEAGFVEGAVVEHGEQDADALAG